MKWQIVLEVQLFGADELIESLLDRAMEYFVDEGVQDPGIGAALAPGFTQIEFVVDAPTVDEAHSRAREILFKALPPQIEIVGDSTRRAELVPV